MLKKAQLPHSPFTLQHFFPASVEPRCSGSRNHSQSSRCIDAAGFSGMTLRKNRALGFLFPAIVATVSFCLVALGIAIGPWVGECRNACDDGAEPQRDKLRHPGVRFFDRLLAVIYIDGGGRYRPISLAPTSMDAHLCLEPSSRTPNAERLLHEAPSDPPTARNEQPHASLGLAQTPSPATTGPGRL